MKKIYITLFLLFVITGFTKAQPIIWSEGFETTLINTVPAGWSWYDNTGENIGPDTNWTVRDSGSTVPGVNAIRHARSHTGLKATGVSWVVGTTAAGITDAWLVTKKLRNVPGDALFSFWATGGTPTLNDSLQIWISTTDSLPASFLSTPTHRDQTIFFPPNPIYAQYKQYFIDLAAYAGQSIFVGFRYYMDVSVDGVFVQMDDAEYTGTVGIIQNGTTIPTEFSLNQNYPNPFNPTTKINFDISKASNVKLTVFNSLGQVVINLFDGFKPAGSYQAEFNASSLSSGTYYYRLDTDFFTETKKMQLVK